MTATQWSHFFNLSNELLSVVSFHGKLLQVNRKWQQVLGYGEDELIGRSYLELLHSDDMVRTAEVQAELERLSQQPNEKAQSWVGQDFRNRYRHASGHFIWITWSSYVDRDQQVIYFVGRESSREVQVELVQQAMRRIQNAFLFSSERMLNPFNEMLAIINEIVGATLSFIGMFNLYGKELPYCRFLSHHCKKDAISPFREHALQQGIALAALRRIINEINKGSQKILCIQDEQPLIPLPFFETHAELNDFVILPIQIGSDVLGIIGLGAHKNAMLVHDLEVIRPILQLCTELLAVERGKQREQGLQDLVARKNRLLSQSHKMAKIGGWEIDTIAHDMYWSDELYALLECDREERVGVSELIQCCENSSRAIFARLMQRLLLQGESFDGEYIFHTLTGKPKWTRVSGRAVFDHQGRITHCYGIIQDISDHKKMHAILMRQEEDLQTLVSSLDDIIIEINLREMRVQKVWAKDPYFFSEPTHKLEGKFCSDVLPPMIWKSLSSSLRQVMNMGVAVVEEVQAKDRKWYGFHINPVYMGGPDLTFCSVRIRDLTEVKQKEQRSIEQLALLKTLADASPAIIWMSDVEGIFTYLNREWAEYTGTIKEGLGSGNWLRFLHSDDMAQAGAALQKALMDRQSFTNNFRIRRKDGEYHWFVNRGQPILDHEGQYRGFVGTCLDINQQIRLEEEKQTLKKLIDSSPDVFCYCDKYGFPLYLNEAAQNNFGWHNKIESIHSFIAVSEVNRIMKEAWKVAAKGEIWEGETLFKNLTSGEEVPVWLRIFALRDELGRARFFAMNAVDIRKKKDTETKLFHASKMATLGEMAGGIAHEINNPLAIIQGAARKIRREVERLISDNEIIKHDFTVLELTTLRISKIVKGLKTFARDGERDPMIPSTLKSIIDDALALCYERFRDHGIDVIVDAFDEDIVVTCRAVQVCQALLNLLNNAHDAIYEEDEKWIKIAVSCTEDKVEIRVIDSGRGIPAEVVTRIMQPFYTTKPIGKGTGLGLSIARGLIESHGGQLWYEPESENTCFVIELPVERAVASTQEVA